MPCPCLPRGSSILIGATATRTDLLGACPGFACIFDGLACEKLSFRLLRRAPNSAYGWHRDDWKGPCVARFQVPIFSDESALLVLTDYEDVRRISARGGPPPDARWLAEFADAHAGHVRCFRLDPGKLHYFDTTRVHTLINPGGEERITLSFDLLANPWLMARFPEIRSEVGEWPGPGPPRPGRSRQLVGRGMGWSHGLRNRARHWLRNGISEA
jgi:hypothetical protein